MQENKEDQKAFQQELITLLEKTTLKIKDKKDGQGVAFLQADEIGLNADRYETVVSYDYEGFKLSLEFFDEVDHSFISQAVYSPKGEYISTPFLDLRVFSEGHEDKGLVNLRAFRQFVDACLSYTTTH